VTLPLREGRPLRALVAIPALVALTLTLFAWPAARLEPRDLPLGVVGANAITGPSGAFSIHRYADEAAARSAIADRDVYGAVVADRGRTTLLVASAASPVVAQLLERALASPGTAVVDVRPAPAADPRGAAFAASVLPLVLASIVLGALLAFLARPGATRLLLLPGAAVGAGLAADGIVQGWLGVLGGAWWQNAGVLALTLLAIAASIVALAGVGGLPGLALAAALMMLVGNPLSAASSAPELMPHPFGTIGQLLPPGAGASALRGTAYFDGAGTMHGLVVLGVWATVALAVVAIPRLRPTTR